MGSHIYKKEKKIVKNQKSQNLKTQLVWIFMVDSYRSTKIAINSLKGFEKNSFLRTTDDKRLVTAIALLDCLKYDTGTNMTQGVLISFPGYYSPPA